MTDSTYPTPSTAKISKPSISIFTPGEGRAISIILLALLSWLILALITSRVYPDTETANFDTAQKYFNYALRNGGAFITVCGAIFGTVSIFRMMAKTGDASLIDYVKTHYARDKTPFLMVPVKLLITAGKLILGFVTFSIFLFSYSTIKTRIPEITPYSWDEGFNQLDRILFFGNDPWTVLSWIYEIPSLLRGMDFIYDIWAVILVGTWTLCFITTKHKAYVRYRFPIALLLTWFIGGNILAILLSSAGPCYYGAVTGLADPYAAQMAALSAIDATAPLRAFQYQEILWSIYESPSLGLGGISAMPSMHCATSFLLVLLAWNKKILRYAALAFFGFILITSFMLAWHYAVDGVLAVPIAMAGWHLSGFILRKTAPSI